MILHFIQIFIGAFAVLQGFILSKDFVKNREKNLTAKQYGIYWGSGLIINFFDYLGIGSLAPTMSLYKLTGTVDDELIPGTLVTGCAVPVAVAKRTGSGHRLPAGREVAKGDSLARHDVSAESGRGTGRTYLLSGTSGGKAIFFRQVRCSARRDRYLWQ